MELFPVYPLFDIEPVKGKGSWVWDKQGQKYLDLYGGHAVISIGHSHPHYVARLQEQVARLGFYSNSVHNPLQTELAHELGQQSGYDDYSLFLINSGAEAMENALKLASFHTGRRKVLVMKRAFHGRTSAAVSITDNSRIVAPINEKADAVFLEWENLAELEEHLSWDNVCALVIEGIQGIGGIHVPTKAYLQKARELCDRFGTVLIMDEIQSGFGRSGQFFAHQHAGVRADLIPIAKGMGNGFPVGGVLISPDFEASFGLLGTTFGGNHLACAASLAVLEVLKEEELLKHATELGAYVKEELQGLKGVKEVRGLGLMLGLEMEEPVKALRKQLLFEDKIFTGSSSQPNVLRLLPPLNVSKAEVDLFLEAFSQRIHQPIS